MLFEYKTPCFNFFAAVSLQEQIQEAYKVNFNIGIPSGRFKILGWRFSMHQEQKVSDSNI
jgi:hypothetical protein